MKDTENLNFLYNIGMSRIEKKSSGISVLDKLIDFLYIGDNVVWEVEAGLKYEIFLESFVKQSQKEGQTVIYVSFDSSPSAVVQSMEACKHNTFGQNFFLLDCFTNGKGRGDKTFVSYYDRKQKGTTLIENTDSPDDLINTLKKWDDSSKSYGSRYVFDSITGMLDLWKDPLVVQKFFTYMCPRLYDLDTIAYWMLESSAHGDEFKANIRHITQVVLELSRKNGNFIFQPLKLSRRSSNRHFRKITYTVEENEISFEDPDQGRKVEIGPLIRELRLSKKISQKDFAARIKMTPSYVSQIETNQLIPSLPAFLDMCGELDVDPNTLLKAQVHKEPEYIIRMQNIMNSITVKGQEYALYNICSDLPGRLWLLELKGKFGSMELLEQLGVDIIGMYIIENRVSVLGDDGRELSASKGDFIKLDGDNPVTVQALYERASLLLTGFQLKVEES